MDIRNRELSWLAFNDRVLQEALDQSVPVIERMRFLGIYSNNLDEFFRVRVAYVKRMVSVDGKSVQGFDGSPKDLLDTIRSVVIRQQKKLQIAYKRIIKDLEKEGIYHVNNENLNETQILELKEYFNLKLKHAIVPIMLNQDRQFPELKDSGIYLAVKMNWDNKMKKQYALIKIPNEFSRFYRMKEEEKEFVILLDDIIRLNLNSIFSIFTFDTITAHTFKFTRDAELDLDDDISMSFMEKIMKSIKKRKVAEPVRFVFDKEMPEDLLDFLLESLKLKTGTNPIPGGRYHNFKDFISFPDFGREHFVFPQRPPHMNSHLEKKRSLIKQIMKEDVLLHFPYQRFDYVVDLLREAAIDPKVRSIKINIYRLASQSQVMNALMNAVSNGKEVVVILELQARFDEENNLFWANKLKDAGATVSYGLEGLKIHSKLIQIYRVGSRSEQLVTYVGSGNFNEKTARLYEDVGLLTTDDRIAKEVKKVFDLMLGNVRGENKFETLIVSPFNTRDRIAGMVEREIINAGLGLKAEIRIKLNNVVDAELIRLLYKASMAGVRIRMMVRGICCVVTQDEQLSKNIKIRSIVGRYLEHSRFLIFENNGNPEYYITSGDWMERNLDKRIEVAAPIYDKKIQQQLEDVFDILWKGNVKARIIDRDQTNRYFRDKTNKIGVFNSQEELYKYYGSKN